jgi:hypothetical protein
MMSNKTQNAEEIWKEGYDEGEKNAMLIFADALTQLLSAINKTNEEIADIKLTLSTIKSGLIIPVKDDYKKQYAAESKIKLTNFVKERMGRSAVATSSN